MTINFSPGDDWADLADGLETVVVSRPDSAWTFTTTSALRSPIWGHGRKPVSDDRATRAETLWRLSTLGVLESPAIGDILTDAQGTAWTVLHVDHAPRTNTWRCRARNVIAYHELDDFVDIETAEYIVDETGHETTTWHAWRTGAAARWGVRTTRLEEDKGEERADERTALFLADSLSLDHTHRIRRTDGALFYPITCKTPSEPGEPTEIITRPFVSRDTIE